MVGPALPDMSPADDATGRLEAALSSPFEAERDALWAEGLARAREALLDAAVDRLLRDPPSSGWLAERVDDELGPAAPERLLRRASSAAFSSTPDRTAAAVRFLFRDAEPGTALRTARSLDSADTATAFVSAAAAGAFSPDGEVPSSLLGKLGAPAPPSALGRLCTHPESTVRRAAAQALSLLAPGDALAPLEILAADADPSVRSACYWAARTLSLSDPGAAQLLAVAIHVEDDPELRTMLDGLLSSAPLPPVRIADIVRSVGTVDGPAEGADLRLLGDRIDEIPDGDLLDLVDLACILFVVSRLSGWPALRRRLRSVAALLRRPSLGLFEERDPLAGWDAFVTAAFLAIASSGDDDPLVLDCETKGVLELVHDEPFLTDEMKRQVALLTRGPLSATELVSIAEPLGAPGPSVAAHLALVVLVQRGEPLKPPGRVRLDDTSGRPLHLRLRILGEALGQERGLPAALRSRSVAAGLGGLTALLAAATLRDAAALADLRARLVAGEAEHLDLLHLGAALLLPAEDRLAFVESLRAAGRGALAESVERGIALCTPS